MKRAGLVKKRNVQPFAKPHSARFLAVQDSPIGDLVTDSLTESFLLLPYKAEMQKRVDTADISVLIFSYSCANFLAVYAQTNYKHCAV